MKNEQNTISDLKYVKEHLYCEDYFSDEKAILSVAEMKANEYFIKEKVDSPKMLFVLSGTMVISTGSAVKQEVKGGQMFLVVTGDNFYGIAVTDLIILRCDFDRNMSLCNKYSIENLRQYLDADKQRQKKRIKTLPIHNLLFQELKTIEAAISTKLSCIHYQRIKRDILFIMFRAFYEKEQLALFLAPLLGEDSDFKEKVLQVYSQVETAQELMEKLNMSPTVFKRKFQDSFGNTPPSPMVDTEEKGKAFPGHCHV